MHMHIGDTPLDFASDFEVRCSRKVRMDASLHADLGGPRGPRLLRAVTDLLQGQRVRVGIGAALRERAEPAAGVADVREVDVAGDDVGHVLAADLSPQCVSDAGQGLQVGALGGKESYRLIIGKRGRITFHLPEGGGYLAGPGEAGKPWRPTWSACRCSRGGSWDVKHGPF